MRQDGHPPPGGLQGPDGLSADTLDSRLEAVEAAFDSLNLSDGELAQLDPDARRSLHDRLMRLQDRLMSGLSAVVDGMAADGADLVDDRGVPRHYSTGGSGTSDEPSEA